MHFLKIHDLLVLFCYLILGILKDPSKLVIIYNIEIMLAWIPVGLWIGVFLFHLVLWWSRINSYVWGLSFFICVMRGLKYMISEVLLSTKILFFNKHAHML